MNMAGFPGDRWRRACWVSGHLLGVLLCAPFAGIGCGILGCILAVFLMGIHYDRLDDVLIVVWSGGFVLGTTATLIGGVAILFRKATSSGEVPGTPRCSEGPSAGIGGPGLSGRGATR